MLIIEGSDNLGKTKAAKRLLELSRSMAEWEHPTYYSHMSRPHPSFNFSTDYIPRMSVDAIQDRFHLGSLVWHQGVMTDVKLRWLEGHLRIRGSFIVIFVASDRDWYDKHLQGSPKPEMFGHHALLNANDKYRSLVDSVDHDIVVDVSGEKWPDDAMLYEWLTEWKLRLDLLRRTLNARAINTFTF